MTLHRIPYPSTPLAEVAWLYDSLHKTPVYSDTGYPMIRVTDIHRGFVDLTDTKNVDEKTFQEFTRNYTPTVGDTLFTRVGSFGNSCYVNGTQRFCLGQNTVCIKPLREKIDPFYLYCCLNSTQLQDQIVSFVGGASQPTISLQNIRLLSIPFPKFQTQRKIAAILSAYDDLIENNTRRIKILEEMAQAIYREWFVNFRFPGHESVQMVESELGLVPEEWEIRKIGDIAEEVRRNVEPNMVHPDTPYFGLEHIPRKSIALSEWGVANDVQSTKHQFFKGEILFGKIRPYFHKVGVAPVDGVCSSDAIVIQPKKPEYFGLVLFCVSSEDFVSLATQTSQGTKMPRANWNVLVNYPVVIPPKALLDEFNNIASDTVDLIIMKIFQNANLRRTRDLLLPKLISGEIDVSGLDIRTSVVEAG